MSDQADQVLQTYLRAKLDQLHLAIRSQDGDAMARILTSIVEDGHPELAGGVTDHIMAVALRNMADRLESRAGGRE